MASQAAEHTSDSARSEDCSSAEAQLDIASAVIGNRTKSLIVRHLWQNGPSPSKQILSATQISGPTMSLAMQQLESWNIVSASIPPEKRHGRTVVYTLHRQRVQELVKLWFDFVAGPSADDDQPAQPVTDPGE